MARRASIESFKLCPWKCHICGKRRFRMTGLLLKDKQICLPCAKAITRRVNRHALWLNNQHKAAVKERRYFRDYTGPAIEELMKE